ncbi:MAG: UDP-3-O-(3-hydroxymyristoyl)glucosamine N-acyltransferase [Gammaproteobacteria bacterium]|nr:UDP-3-O-(3-hydroxymyristoyl)glucosamine N-acyltransferase [Gammaproteobacteria bacterium]
MYTLGELAKRVDAELVGDANCVIERLATLKNAGAGDIAFFSNPRYRKYLNTTAASAVIISVNERKVLNTNGLVVQNPYVVYARIAGLLHPNVVTEQGIHHSSIIDGSSQVDPTAYVGPNCVIGAGAVIGANSYIGSASIIGKNVCIGEQAYFFGNVTVCSDVVIGDRVILHPGVVIGADGFGLAQEEEEGRWLKIPQLGAVRIGNDVEIGANTTVDRGAIEDTVIDDGVKLDNLIQVAHNVCIGAHTVIAALTGVAGSVKIGKHCTIAGQVGFVGHIEIVDNVVITGKSLITRSITKAGTYSSGMPMMEHKQWRRNSVRYKQLDEIARRLKTLEDKYL